MEEKVAILKTEDLSEETMRMAERIDPQYGLEGGDLYDGQFFREFDGTILKEHPVLP